MIFPAHGIDSFVDACSEWGFSTNIAETIGPVCEFGMNLSYRQVAPGEGVSVNSFLTTIYTQTPSGYTGQQAAYSPVINSTTSELCSGPPSSFSESLYYNVMSSGPCFNTGLHEGFLTRGVGLLSSPADSVYLSQSGGGALMGALFGGLDGNTGAVPSFVPTSTPVVDHLFGSTPYCRIGGEGGMLADVSLTSSSVSAMHSIPLTDRAPFSTLNIGMVQGTILPSNEMSALPSAIPHDRHRFVPLAVVPSPTLGAMNVASEFLSTPAWSSGATRSPQRAAVSLGEESKLAEPGSAAFARQDVSPVASPGIQWMTIWCCDVVTLHPTVR